MYLSILILLLSVDVISEEAFTNNHLRKKGIKKDHNQQSHLFTVAPSLSKSSTTLSWPSAHAKCKAVLP